MSSQGASNSGGQGAGQNFVKFSRQSAQRIAKAVRIVEAGDRGQGGITFDHPQFNSSLKVKVATFTGAWGIGQYKTVTILDSSATASVKNFCVPVTSTATETRNVIFCVASGTNAVLEIQSGVTSTCNFVVGNVDLREVSGYDAGQVQLLGHGASACLVWYSVTTCSTSTAS
ncbi:MAG: hypothetical protein EBQ89_11220 [Alphaproteobacteria bacterium]|nr:hypothetical protein [Alphaproteobacteria bacterium]